MVSENDAVEIINYAERHGISVFLDGGWGVDALLGRQTREHNDIDLFIEKDKGEEFIALLKQKGFQKIRKDYTTPAHTAWQDEGGRVVDLHLYESGENGTFLFEGNSYPAETFSATGRIADREVRCIPPREQVLFHCGYEWDENDTRDVRLLCGHFGIPLPEEYRE